LMQLHLDKRVVSKSPSGGKSKSAIKSNISYSCACRDF
jgi:hypothetical protein